VISEVKFADGWKLFSLRISLQDHEYIPEFVFSIIINLIVSVFGFVLIVKHSFCKFGFSVMKLTDYIYS
jgi:hypothetical protein